MQILPYNKTTGAFNVLTLGVSYLTQWEFVLIVLLSGLERPIWRFDLIIFITCIFIDRLDVKLREMFSRNQWIGIESHNLEVD